MAEDSAPPAAPTESAAAEDPAAPGDPEAPGEPTAPEDPAVPEEASEPDEPARSEQEDGETTSSAPTRTPVYRAATRLTCGKDGTSLTFTITFQPPAE